MALSENDVQTILQFFMEQLPEDKLAELDARIDGSAAPESPAMDSALAKRRQFLALDSHTRQAIRESNRTDAQKRSSDRAAFEQRFPHASRLR